MQVEGGLMFTNFTDTNTFLVGAYSIHICIYVRVRTRACPRIPELVGVYVFMYIHHGDDGVISEHPRARQR